MSSCIPDLGDIGALPSFSAAMRGYIGLSRVTAAHNLLLAQPFNPFLFQQGQQPFPRLLLDVLQGKVSPDELDEKCKEAQEASKKVVTFTQKKWKCYKSCKELGVHAFARSRGDEWYEEIWKRIFRCGPLRECRSRTLEKCDTCASLKPQSGFSESRWKNSGARDTICKECEDSQTEYRCSVCQVVKARKEYSAAMWQNL